MATQQRQLDTNIWQRPYVQQLTPTAKLAFLYAIDRVPFGYIGLQRMAQHTGLSADLCEGLLSKFWTDRAIPRLAVLEEQEG